jgi:MFS family permease
MKTFLNKITNIDIRKGLFYSIVDAILWAMMFGFADQYLVPYAVAIGANAFQVSLISAAGQISICIAQILGANFIYKYRKRKKVSIITNQIHAISWLFIFYISYITKNVYFVIFFYFIGIFATNFAGPGWLSWMNDLVPPHLRGEFWGKRNKIIGIFQFLSIIFAGFFLNYFKRMSNQFLGFGILFTFAFLFRYLSIIPLKKQYEPPMQYISSKKLEELNFFEFIKSIPLLIKTNFGKFALFSFLMTFSTNFMAPILPVFILKS